jgi:H+-translocating NAD(P) transhydrogenase subunit alpha
MRIGIIKEAQDARVTMIPDMVKQLTGLKNECYVEKGAGSKAFYSDADYEQAGAKVVSREELLKEVNMVISIHPLEEKEMATLNKGTVLISSFQPFVDTTLIDAVAKYPLTAFSLDMVPRITIAQSMDILSSMASIAGYKAVLEAANYLPRYFPMLTTAAGSIPPSKVVILGAGVAGLQAIATAKRLGAIVEAFDTRLASKEEVQSLGAKFIEVEGAKDDKSAGGYAVEQSEEYKQKQRALIFEKVSKADVVITTAQIRGKKAPLLITKEMVEAMKPGSVIVDIAASTGGNCELTQDSKVVNHKGVTIIGNSELAAEMPMNASQLYSKNIFNFLKVILKDGELNADWNNPITKSSCVIHEGKNMFAVPA